MSIPLEIQQQTVAALDNAIAMVRDVCRRAAHEPHPGDRSIAHAATDTDPRLARDWDGLIGALVVAQVTGWATLTAQNKGHQPDLIQHP